MKTRKLGTRELRKLLPDMPFNTLVGLKLARTHVDGVTLECPVRQELLNGHGVLHGGVTATLVDAAVGFALFHHFHGAKPVTTVELKVNYFRPVKSGKILARAFLQRVGSSICVGRVEVSDSGGNLVAAAMVTYMILPAPVESR